jgi:hypothetical protein
MRRRRPSRSLCQQRRIARRILAWAGVVLVGLLLGPGIALSDSGPTPPCDAAVSAPYPPFGNPPNVRAWNARDLPRAWNSPQCARWATQRFTLLTALSAKFDFEGDADQLLARFAAISAWRGMKYWSAGDGKFLTLITDSAAVDSSDAERRRPDFSKDEMKPGKDLYFVQDDNRSSGDVTYRMRVIEKERDRLVVTIENVSTVWVVLLPVFEPGDIRTVYIFQKLGEGSWGYYSLLAAKDGGLGIIEGHEDSFISRATGFFHYLVGLPDDHDTRPSP